MDLFYQACFALFDILQQRQFNYTVNYLYIQVSLIHNSAILFIITHLFNICNLDTFCVNPRWVGTMMYRSTFPELESKHDFVVKMKDLVSSLPRSVVIVMRYLFDFLNQ